MGHGIYTFFGIENNHSSMGDVCIFFFFIFFIIFYSYILQPVSEGFDTKEVVNNRMYICGGRYRMVDVYKSCLE